MKKITFLLVCVLASSMTFAARRENPKPMSSSGMGIIRSNGSLFKLFYKSEESSDVTVEIIDSNNTVVFAETIKMSNGFTRPYNFTKLQEGTYTIKLDNGSNWMSEKVEYSKGQVTKSAQVIALKENKYLILMSGSADEHFSVNVLNSYGTVIYSEENSAVGNAAKLFNFKNTAGPFKFEITGSNGYSATIVK